MAASRLQQGWPHDAGASTAFTGLCAKPTSGQPCCSPPPLPDAPLPFLIQRPTLGLWRRSFLCNT